MKFNKIKINKITINKIIIKISNLLNLFFNLFVYYFLLFLGSLAVSWLIWSRFIRKRVIRDIPDPFLSEYRFWLLLYICCIYLYIIKNIVKPKESNIVLQEFLTIVYKPLTTLDHFIKYNKYIKLSYYEFMIKFVNYFGIFNLGASKLKIIIFIMQIVPRIILVSFLLLDTFYFHKLELLYKVVLIGILPLTLRYIKYSLKDILKEWILELENKYSKVRIYEKGYEFDTKGKQTTEAIYHDEMKTIQEYIDIKYQNIFDINNEKVTYEYESTPNCKEEIYKQYLIEKTGINIEIFTRKHILDLKHKDYMILNQLYFKLMPSIISLKLILFCLEIIDEQKIIKWFKITIFSLYIICWSYILIISYLNYPVDFFFTEVLLTNMKYYLERSNNQFLDVSYYRAKTNFITKITIKYMINHIANKLENIQRFIINKLNNIKGFILLILEKIINHFKP